MKKYFVYYQEGYSVEDVGFEEFERAAGAEEFILARHRAGEKEDLDSYTVIYGEKLQIREVEAVTKIVIE